MEALIGYMLGSQDVPAKLYYINNNPEAFRRPGYIIARTNNFNLNAWSVDDFHQSIKQNSYNAPTPWLTVFASKTDAVAYGLICEIPFTVPEIDTSTWYSEGVVVVDMSKLEGNSATTLSSEFLVHLTFPIQSVVDGLEVEKLMWKEHRVEERRREEACERQRKRDDNYRRRSATQTPSEANGARAISTRETPPTSTGGTSITSTCEGPNPTMGMVLRPRGIRRGQY